MIRNYFQNTSNQKSSASLHILKLYLFIWVLLVVIFIGFVIKNDLDKATFTFDQTSKFLTDESIEKMLISETVLESFSAYVSQTEKTSHHELSLYASNLLKRYSFLYMFEVAEMVQHEQRAAIEKHLTTIYPDFYIKRFDYEKTRQWQSVNDSPSYYPITFQEPFFSDKINIVGLDLYSSDFLVEAMRQSYELGIPVATRPFTLAEDERGYVIHRAVGRETAVNQPKPLTANKYALLAIKSEKLFSGLLNISDNISIILRHKGFTSDDGSYPVVLEKKYNKVVSLEKNILPELTFKKDFSDITVSQPFILQIIWQLSWNDFSYNLIIIILFFSIVIPILVKKFIYQYFENRINSMKTDGSLYRLANFDSLTGISNRHRLHEYMEMMRIKSEREKIKFNIFFIDVDNLKPINDSYGHAAGDFILKELCARVEKIIRHDELLARLGGDEFVFVSNRYIDETDVDEIIHRIKGQFTRPVIYKNNQFSITLSIGYAIYPDDGKNINSLLQIADERMYIDKKEHKKRFAE